MKVIQFGRAKNYTHDLSELIQELLKDRTNEDSDVEAAHRLARHSAEAIGNLVTLLVSKNLLSLNEALNVAGMGGTITHFTLAPETNNEKPIA